MNAREQSSLAPFRTCRSSARELAAQHEAFALQLAAAPPRCWSSGKERASASPVAVTGPMACSRPRISSRTARPVDHCRAAYAAGTVDGGDTLACGYSTPSMGKLLHGHEQLACARRPVAPAARLFDHGRRTTAATLRLRSRPARPATSVHRAVHPHSQRTARPPRALAAMASGIELAELRGALRIEPAASPPRPVCVVPPAAHRRGRRRDAR